MSLLFAETAGTRAPQHAAPSNAKQFVLAGLVAGSVLGGTLGAVSPVEVVPRVAVAPDRTLPAAPSVPSPAQAQPALPQLLQRLRRVSGLSWGEIAAAIGVSRRAVHHWLAGDRISATHLKRLIALVTFIEPHAAGDPDRTRALLTQAGGHDRSPLDDFRLQMQAPRKVARPTASVAELLGDTQAAEQPLPRSRRSALAGGVISAREAARGDA